MSDDEDHRTTELRSFGRRRGRKPSPRQQQLLDDLLPRLAVDLSAPCPPQGPRALFHHDCDAIWLEIGFGGGEHLLWQASVNRAVGLIGCEPYLDGVVKVLSEIEAAGLRNVRLHADDVRPLLRWLPAGSVDRAFVLFPDPWPKKRHVKRRLVAEPLLAALARVMKPGAELRIGTDIGDYARTILIAIAAEGSFEWTARRPRDWRVRPEDWPQTRYEAKALREGRQPYFFRLRRV